MTTPLSKTHCAGMRPNTGALLYWLRALTAWAANLPLREIVALKKKYDFQLMVDEAHLLGTLGATGRGIAEHAAVARNDVDL
ncbi:hypothetical protein [Paenarthrobacter sp. NPDC091669]|uniref:hypothetical protein n=1 Tax=Paenarthrobacter sp. NPDC091669 TaxID=3364384 RepID=UPI0037FC303C